MIRGTHTMMDKFLLLQNMQQKKELELQNLYALDRNQLKSDQVQVSRRLQQEIQSKKRLNTGGSCDTDELTLKPRRTGSNEYASADTAAYDTTSTEAKLTDTFRIRAHPVLQSSSATRVKNPISEPLKEEDNESDGSREESREFQTRDPNNRQVFGTVSERDSQSNRDAEGPSIEQKSEPSEIRDERSESETDN